MSAYRTSGSTTDPLTGLPVITGVVYRTVSGLLYTTVPVGEPFGGVNNYPGVDPNFPGTPAARVTSTRAVRVTTTGAIRITKSYIGAPYGFVGPVYIGALVP